MQVEAATALQRLRAIGDLPVIVPQVIYEYWVVATRPANQNGLGQDPMSTRQAVNEFIFIFLLLRDERGIFARWLDIVSTNLVTGKSAHDARLVAAMKRHGLTHIVTFNTQDFARYNGITVLAPSSVP